MSEQNDLISRQEAIDYFFRPYSNEEVYTNSDIREALLKLSPAEPQVDKAFRLFVEWAVNCGFGYDNIPNEYEKYKDDIKGMRYTDGLIYIAKMEVKNEC